MAIAEIQHTKQDSNYKICTNCIMDTTDPNITFDERGWCDYCRNFHARIKPRWHPDAEGEAQLKPIIAKIKRHGKNKKYDCLIGISGGIDSSYVAYIAKERFGLRPLIVHVDAGWNSQEAVNNIERLIDGLKLDLHTHVVNWEEMKDLQLAFLKAQVPHQDTPQDHAFFAGLYNFAAAQGFRYVLTGANYATESVREPFAWHYTAMDLRHLKDIHRRFGRRPLKSFPLVSLAKYKLYYRYIKGVTVIKPLNCVPYTRADAISQLEQRFGWQAYGHKHYESRFTRFYEGYFLPTKFGYEKRRAHYSSLILSGQLAREDALQKIAIPAYDEDTIEHDIAYVAKKLGLTSLELKELMKGENKSFHDYKSSYRTIKLGLGVMRMFGKGEVLKR